MGKNSTKKLAVPLIIVVGVIISLLIPYLLYKRNESEVRSEFNVAAQDRVIAIQHNINKNIPIGNSVVGLFAASRHVTREEFHRFAQQILKDNPSIKAVEWIPHVHHEKRQLYEEEASKYFPGFQFTQIGGHSKLVRREDSSEYYPVYYLEPYDGNENALGFDLASNPSRLAALEKSRDNRLPSTTEKIELVQSGSDRWGFLMYFPVYKNGVLLDTLEQRRNNLFGFALLVFDIQSLVESALDIISPSGVNLVLEDVTTTQSGDILYYHSSRLIEPGTKSEYSPDLLKESDLIFKHVFSVNDRKWMLTAFPANSYFSLRSYTELWFVGFSGLFISILLWSNFRLILSREKALQQSKTELEKTVLERTEELIEKNKELEAYSSSISHELRAPLRSIIGFSQIVQEEAGYLKEQEKSNIQRILAAGVKLDHLISDLLEYARVSNQPVHRDPVDLSELANEIKDTLQINYPDINFKWQLEQGIIVEGNEIFLKQLLHNLLSNACKYSQREEHPIIEFGKITEQDGNIYYVRDNGIGINMKNSKKIFEQFQRLHSHDEYEGTGIGLAIVSKIIKRHHGKIWVDSKAGEGATFKFTLGESTTDMLN